jgi:hypothetical protein
MHQMVLIFGQEKHHRSGDVADREIVNRADAIALVFVELNMVQVDRLDKSSSDNNESRAINDRLLVNVDDPEFAVALWTTDRTFMVNGIN